MGAHRAVAHPLPQHEHHVVEVRALEDVEVLDVEAAPVARRVLSDRERPGGGVPEVSHRLVVDLEEGGADRVLRALLRRDLLEDVRIERGMTPSMAVGL